MTAPLVDVARLVAQFAELVIALPWEYHEGEMMILPSPSDIEAPGDETKRSGWVAEASSPENGRAIVALANALPALLRELSDSRAAVEAARGEALEEAAKAVEDQFRSAPNERPEYRQNEISHGCIAAIQAIRALRAPGGAS